MDPDATLAELMTRAHQLLAMDPGDVDNDAFALAQGLVALDRWLSAGGFLPGSWTPGTSSFTLAVACDGAAFADFPHAELCRILRSVGDTLLLDEDAESSGEIRDHNGNTVGTWRYHRAS